MKVVIVGGVAGGRRGLVAAHAGVGRAAVFFVARVFLGAVAVAFIRLAVTVARVAVVARAFAVGTGDEREVREHSGGEERAGELSAGRHLFSPCLAKCFGNIALFNILYKNLVVLYTFC